MLDSLLVRFAATCANPPGFFGFPTWYKYVPSKLDVVGPDGISRCEIVNFQIADFPYVVLALVDIALRIAALAAVGYIIYGGIQFILAQGEPDKTKKARQTIINAIIGLIIAMFATGIVGFIGSRIG